MRFIDDCISLSKKLNISLFNLKMRDVLGHVTTLVLIDEAKIIINFERNNDYWANDQNERDQHEFYRKRFLNSSNLFKRFVKPKYSNWRDYFEQARKRLDKESVN